MKVVLFCWRGVMLLESFVFCLYVPLVGSRHELALLLLLRL